MADVDQYITLRGFQRGRQLACVIDDVKNLSQIWAVAPALVKLALRDDRRSQIDKEPPWKRIAKGLI
jgi:hypothetical protein